MRSHHDMGGQAAGKVEPAEHDYAPWEKRVDALLQLLSAPQRQLMRVDELRRNIEALPPDAYERMTYYERWMASIAATLLQRGVITADELARKMADVDASTKEDP
jgi:Nitrile hydratase beta subunit